MRTRPDELSCDECFEMLDAFADLVHAGRNADEMMPLVRHHLNQCRDCEEEFTILLRMLDAHPGGSA